MTIFLLIGLLGMVFVIFLKGPIINLCNENSKLGQRLKKASWFQNHWQAGALLFIMNAVLFLTAILLLYGLMFIIIPFTHLLVMISAVIASLFVWATINKVWQGTKRNRLKMAAVGSSFYLMLTLLFVYRLVTLQPAYPGDDPFMQAIILFMIIIVSTTAFIMCLAFTGFRNGEK